MWIRLSSAEIAEVERKHRLSRFNPIPPALAAFAFACFDSLMRWGGWRGKLVPPGSPIPFTEAFSSLPAFFIFCFLIFYGYRVFVLRSLPKDGTLICTKCFEAADGSASAQCECGGRRELLYFWRWQREDKTN
jgi:hypothetical protein